MHTRAIFIPCCTVLLVLRPEREGRGKDPAAKHEMLNGQVATKRLPDKGQLTGAKMKCVFWLPRTKDLPVCMSAYVCVCVGVLIGA